MKRGLVLLGMGMVVAAVTAEEVGWPSSVEAVSVVSSRDGRDQPALFWRAEGRAPLLVALHTWSSDYRQAGGSLAYWRWCQAQGWHFIQPNFRGRNGSRESMGSGVAVQDVVDAVRFAEGGADVDADRIYLVGVSGGGHMALLVAGRHPEIWAGVSAWCGISDIARWHRECAGSESFRRYAGDIERALGGVPEVGSVWEAEAWQRSPLSVLSRARSVPIDIAAGVEDGRSGSVPFAHSLRAFNPLAADVDKVTEVEVGAFYQERVVPSPSGDLEDQSYEPREIVFRRQSGQARVTVFDGGHEILHVPALNWLAQQRRGQPALWRLGAVLPVPGAEGASKSGL